MSFEFFFSTHQASLSRICNEKSFIIDYFV